MAVSNLALFLARQYLVNRGGFRRYVHEQAFLALPPLLLKAAQELIPSIRSEHLELSKKWLFVLSFLTMSIQAMEDDFLCLSGPASTHVLNAISPAFTASFALADLILNHAMPEFNFV